MVGDEAMRETSITSAARQRTAIERLEQFKTAVRVNRQLAATLRSQGMNEDADRFVFRAQLCQRIVLRRQRNFLRYLGSLLLNLHLRLWLQASPQFLCLCSYIGVFAVLYLVCH